ncbi:MAG TPA: hypothetical protein VNZ01_01235 [Solirubrobacteraceae bacterium]|nr:hypothetical protein [Solirubrobacteraceae bacterium]
MSATQERKPAVAAVPRLALTREEAAASIGISLDSFERHVQPSIRMIRRGRLRVVPVSELARWTSEEAGTTLP